MSGLLPACQKNIIIFSRESLMRDLVTLATEGVTGFAL